MNTVSNIPDHDGGGNLPSFLHPSSGAVILLLDCLFFGGEIWVFSAPLSCAVAFCLSFVSIYIIQRRRSGDSRLMALLKAFFGGIVTAIPTPIAGTVIGSLVIIASGRRHFR